MAAGSVTKRYTCLFPDAYTIEVGLALAKDQSETVIDSNLHSSQLGTRFCTPASISNYSEDAVEKIEAPESVPKRCTSPRCLYHIGTGECDETLHIP